MPHHVQNSRKTRVGSKPRGAWWGPNPTLQRTAVEVTARRVPSVAVVGAALAVLAVRAAAPAERESSSRAHRLHRLAPPLASNDPAVLDGRGDRGGVQAMRRTAILCPSRGVGARRARAGSCAAAPAPAPAQRRPRAP